MGEGVLVYFGYPAAHEDDAERAVRAGLGVIDAVGCLDVKAIKLQARVGIATGLVVVGDLIGAIGATYAPVVGFSAGRLTFGEAVWLGVIRSRVVAEVVPGALKVRPFPKLCSVCVQISEYEPPLLVSMDDNREVRRAPECQDQLSFLGCQVVHQRFFHLPGPVPKPVPSKRRPASIRPSVAAE
jgi:hypothetical protein